MLEHVRLHLISSASVGAIGSVSGAVGVVPKNTSTPYFVVRQIAASPMKGLEGAYGTINYTFIVECWDKDPLGADSLATAVRKVLDGFTGDLGNGGATITIGDMWMTDGDLDVVPVPGGEEAGLYAHSLTFSAWAEEAQPTT